MKNTLFKQLTGSWTLVALIEVPVDGSEIAYPMGRNPKGLIIYNQDGYMSAQIMNPDSIKTANENTVTTALSELAQGYTKYLAYSGTFNTDDEKQIVKHIMYVSLFPDWVGNTQIRLVRFSDGFLYLESGEPFISDGRLVTHKLTWKRLQD